MGCGGGRPVRGWLASGCVASGGSGGGTREAVSSVVPANRFGAPRFGCLLTSRPCCCCWCRRNLSQRVAVYSKRLTSEGDALADEVCLPLLAAISRLLPQAADCFGAPELRHNSMAQSSPTRLATAIRLAITTHQTKSLRVFTLSLPLAPRTCRWQSWAKPSSARWAPPPASSHRTPSGWM